MVFDFAEGLDGPIYLDPNNPNHQAAIEQLRATRKPAVPYAVSPVGRMRDLGDPNDSRRGQSAPQSRSVPGLPDPIDLLIESARSENSVTADTPIPGPSQTASSSAPNTDYVDREFGIQRGFGAGGGAQVDSPMSANSGEARLITREDDNRQIVGPNKGRRVYNSAARVARRNPPGGSVSFDRGSAADESVELALERLEQELGGLGIPSSEGDAEILSEYAGGRRPSENVEGTRVIQTQDRKKPKGFSSVSDANIDDMYTGSTPVPNTTGKEISPFYTVDVPTRGKSGQVDGTKRIDPRATYRTDQADSETLANALHANQEEVRTSNANFASQVQKENRTPLITTDQFNEGLRSGSIIQVANDRNHIADLIGPDGEKTPIFSTKIRDDSEVRAPMYRVGAPTNVDLDAAREQLNPREKEVSSVFDTQIVRTRPVVKRDAEGKIIPDPKTGKLARTEGFAVETGPTPFLSRDDLMPTIGGLRRNVEKAVDQKTPDGDVDTNIAKLDQVLRELSGGGYMSDPDVADGYQRMAVEIDAGRMPASAVPERARAEVAQALTVLQAARGPVDRVPIQTSSNITEVVPVSEADLVAQEINGSERNFDGDGRVVQGSFGDFGFESNDDRPTGGYSTFDAPDLEFSPEFQAAKVAVDEQFGFTNLSNNTISGENQVKLNQLSGQVLADAVAATPAPMVSAQNKQFQAQLRASAAKLGGQNVNVLQGRSMPIPTPNEQAVAETAAPNPQSQAEGIANTESVSQLNAPAPQRNTDVDPEVARLLPYVGNGVRQSQIDLISKGLAAEPGSATRTGADQLLALFRKRFR